MNMTINVTENARALSCRGRGTRRKPLPVRSGGRPNGLAGRASARKGYRLIQRADAFACAEATAKAHGCAPLQTTMLHPLHDKTPGSSADFNIFKHSILINDVIIRHEAPARPVRRASEWLGRAGSLSLQCKIIM
jgi:hypothetical protein